MEKFKTNQMAANLRYNRGAPPEKERKAHEMARERERVRIRESVYEKQMIK